MSSSPLLSVLIPTYNHEDYIADCIEGALMQRTDFDFEVLIGEDDSDDETRNICIEYSKKYSDKIRLFLNERSEVIYINNVPTGRANLLKLLNEARGQYIALCEGDDRWIDENKIQKQVYFLENNKGFSFCFHDCYIEDGGKYRKFSEKRVTEGKDSLVLDSYDLLASYNAPIQTATFVGRNFDCTDLPDWFYSFPSGDRPLFIYLSTLGFGYYFNSLMSIYRKHEGNLSKRNIDSNLMKIHKKGLNDMAHYLSRKNNDFKDYYKASKKSFRGYLFVFYMRNSRDCLKRKSYLNYILNMFKVIINIKYSYYNFRDIIYILKSDIFYK